jgi:hypothetical protein
VGTLVFQWKNPIFTLHDFPENRFSTIIVSEYYILHLQEQKIKKREQKLGTFPLISSTN